MTDKNNSVLQELLSRQIIPVIVIEDAKDAVPLAGALLEGGMDVIEITFRTAAAAEAISQIAAKFPEMLVGAGTVLNPIQARQAMDAGARFGLAPGLNPGTVTIFQQSNILFIPGVMTPSEIEQGMALGCRLLKFFPAEALGGASMLAALAGPYASQDISFCPTGGIGLDNMNAYLALPCVAAIGGSWLATRQQIAEQDWRIITAQAKQALAACATDNR